ncbi:MAG TPA: phosphatase PAP2 family protein [Thermoanaerobaculia bacterium]
MSIDDKSRYAAAAFVVLLLLSIVWPAPVVSINRLWLHEPIPIDELSFLGRESPSWDVVFWFIAGLFAIAVVQSGEPAGEISVWRRRLRRRWQVELPRGFMIALAGAAAIVAFTWLLADSAIVAVAERVSSEAIEDTIRYANRLGGGMNPPMIIAFFLIAGVVYRRRRWTEYGIAMALAAITAGIFAQIVKFAVARTRPELWLGPFHYARTTANSFPSGHTVAAFALGGVLLFASRNVPLRVMAMLLAIFVAVARVLAFRHWPSDVVASALISLLAAWIATSALLRVDVGEVHADEP